MLCSTEEEEEVVVVVVVAGDTGHLAPNHQCNCPNICRLRDFVPEHMSVIGLILSWKGKAVSVDSDISNLRQTFVVIR